MKQRQAECNGEGTDSGSELPGSLEGGGACRCDMGVAGSPGLMLAALAWVWLRRGLVAVMVALPSTPGAAWAQDAQRSIIDGGDWLYLRESRMPDAWSPAVTLSVNRATKLATLVGPARTVELLERVTTQELDVSMQLGNVVRLGVSANRHTSIRYLDRARQPEWGDFSVWAMLPMSNQDGEGLEAAWHVQFDQPGNGAGYLLADPGALQGMVALSGDTQWGELSGELGFRLHEPVAIPGGLWADSFQWGVGWRYDHLGPFVVGTEWVGRLPMRIFVLAPVEAPAEGALVVGFRPVPPVTLMASGGAGLNLGLGAPESRLVGAVDVRPRAVEDTDGDGFVDYRDACPRRAEDKDGYRDWDGCPEADNDSDGIADASDACPDEPENLNGIDDQDGCPESVTKLVVVVDTDGEAEWVELTIDGVPMRAFPGEPVAVTLTALEVGVSAQAEDHVQEVQKVELGLQDHVEVRLRLGVQPVGSLRLDAVDGDSPLVVKWHIEPAGLVALAEESDSWELQVPAGAVAVTATADGYLPLTATLDVAKGAHMAWTAQMVATGVRTDGDALVVGEPVFFALDESVIRDEGGLLDLLAWLQAHPEAELVRIEGHADRIGRSRYNYDLSVQRAQAVTAWLVDHGIAVDRLQAIGTGEARVSGAPDDDRRVGFTVLVWAD